ncbi:MAG: MltA domain-containing protein [Rhodobacteraceae bacterium]|nr:MltA domain-containing protein [Paracoccaceae bacterium]
MGFAHKLITFAALCLPVSLSAATYTQLSFSAISGWQQDDLAPALTAFARSCDSIRSTPAIPVREWDRVCALAKAGPGPARAFFEQNFTPVRITTGSRALFTGYYEPELQGSRTQTEKFRFPLYRRPPEIQTGVAWHSRAEIDNGALEGRGLELVWLDNRVDAFFVHVQGAARIRLEDHTYMRVGFAGRNWQRYRSVGRQLIRQGVLTPNQAGMQGIRAWAAANPNAAVRALQHNTSFIFFQELEIPDALGPVGALQVPLAALRSVAVDDSHTPLGAPVWINMNAGENSLNQLMVAQDTGSAVNGAQRADIFYGSGDAAGDKAGNIRYSGEMITLIPNATAARLRGQ